MPADGRWDLTRHLKGYYKTNTRSRFVKQKKKVLSENPIDTHLKIRNTNAKECKIQTLKN